MTSTQLAIQKENFDIFARLLQKINCKVFHRKTYVAQFCEFVYNLLSSITANIEDGVAQSC